MNTKNIAENEENDVGGAEVDKKKNSAEERMTPSENGSEETATTPSTQKEADEDFASSPRSSNHSTISGSQKSRPESSIGNSSWDFGSGALGRRYSKKLQDQQKQKSPSASNSSLDPLSPKSRFKNTVAQTRWKRTAPENKFVVKNHVRDALRDLKIPTREADAVFSALVGMEIAVAGSIDAFFNGVHEKIAKDGNDDHAFVEG